MDSVLTDTILIGTITKAPTLLIRKGPGGCSDAAVPGVVLLGLDAAPGAVAVHLLSRSSSSDVK